MPASTPSVHSGWLVLRPPGSKSVSNKRFFILLSDFVLYSFRSEVDCSALTATPLPGFTVLTGAQLKGDSGSGCSEKDRDKVIKMFHPSSKRTYYFAGTTASDVERYHHCSSLIFYGMLTAFGQQNLTSNKQGWPMLIIIFSPNARIKWTTA